MVTGEKQPHRRSERQKAVAAICGQFFVTYIGSHPSRQIFHIGESMQAYPLITDPKTVSSQFHILQRCRILHREGKVFLYQSGVIRCSGDFIVRQASDGNKPRIVDNPLKLTGRFQKFSCGVLIDLFGDNIAPAER